MAPFLGCPYIEISYSRVVKHISLAYALLSAGLHAVTVLNFMSGVSCPISLCVVPCLVFLVQLVSLLFYAPAGQRNELIGAACFMHVRREELARQFLNQER